MLETGRWEVQVKPFAHLTAHGRVRGAEVIVFVIIVSFATTLFFYSDNTRSDMDSIVFRIT